LWHEKKFSSKQLESFYELARTHTHILSFAVSEDERQKRNRKLHKIIFMPHDITFHIIVFFHNSLLSIYIPHIERERSEQHTINRK
jgi:hypothetical protein